MSRYLLVAVTALALAGCGSDGGGPDPEHYIQMQVSIDGADPIDFMETCTTTRMEFDGEVYWGLEAKDIGRPLGIVITWKQTFVPGPGSYPACSGLSDISTSIVRAHPTDPDSIRISTVGEGEIIFDQVGYTSGDPIAGTFGGVRMERDDPDDTIVITAEDGVFSCRVK